MKVGESVTRKMKNRRQKQEGIEAWFHYDGFTISDITFHQKNDRMYWDGSGCEPFYVSGEDFPHWRKALQKEILRRSELEETMNLIRDILACFSN